MHAGDLLNNLARKSGIPLDSQELITLLSIKQLSEIEVPEPIATAIETKLVAEDAAEARLTGKLKGKHYGEALSSTDAALLEAATENGISSERLKELVKEKSTPTNVKAIAKEIAEIHRKQASGKGNQDELQKQVELANQKLSEGLKQWQLKEAELVGNYESKLKRLHTINFLSTFNHDDSKFSKEEFYDLAMMRLDKALSEKGLSYKANDSDFELIAEGGAPYYDERGNKVSFKDFATGVVANNKMLKTAEPPKNEGEGLQGRSFSGNGNARLTPTAMSAVDQALADLG